MAAVSPIFIDMPPDMRGCITPVPGGGYLTSVFHGPTGRTLYGRETNYAQALEWIECSRLIFCEVRGRA